MRQGKMPVLVWMTILATAPCSTARAESPTTTQEEAKAVEAVTPPTTIKEIQARQTKIAEETKALQPATIPAATQPVEATTQPADYATNLWFKLKSAHELLEAQQKELEAVKKLKSDDSAKELKQQIEEYKANTDKLQGYLQAYEKGRATPLKGMSVPELNKRLEEVTELYERLNQEHNSEVEAQTARINRLGEFKAERQAVNEQIAEARKAHVKAVAEYKDRTTTAKATEDAKPVKVMRRMAELDLLMALVRSEMLTLEEERLSLRQQRVADRLKALQPYVKTLREWMNVITKQISQNQQAYAQWQLEQARAKNKPKYEEIYWEAYLEILKAADKFKSYDNPTRDRYPESQLGKLENLIARYKKYWENFVESVSRRSGEEVLKGYRRIREQLEDARRRDEQLTRDLDKSIDEREAVALRRDQVLEAVDSYEEKLADATSETSDEQATEYQTKLTKHRLELIKLVDDITALQNGLLERLGKALEINDEFIVLLDTYRSQLYWSYLVVQDLGLITLDMSKIKSEWTGEERQANLTRLTMTWEQGTQQLRDTSIAERIASIALLFIGIAGGFILGRRFAGQADGYEEHLAERIREEGIEAAGLSERLWLGWLRLLNEVAPLVCPLLAVMAGLLVLDVTGGAYRVIMGFVLFFGAIWVAFGVARALFTSIKPRYRIMRCSNKVAGYYRKWLYLFLYVTLIGVPIPLFLGLIDSFLATRVYLTQIYKSVALLIVFLFLLRKHMVLKVAGRPEDMATRWGYTLVSSIYPILPLIALGLLVLEVLGFGALTNYIIRNLVLTLAIFLIVTTLNRYVGDLAGKYQRSIEKQRQAEAEAGEVTSDQPQDTVSADERTAPEQPPPPHIEEDEAGEAEFFVAIGSMVLRWTFRLGGFVLILGVWGITLIEIHSALTYPLTGSGDQVITLWRVLAALIVAVMGAVVSRFVRSILNKRVYPAYEALDLGARAAINTILNYLLIILGIYIAMQLIYIDLGALTVLLGTLGLGIGLGLQPLFINFISGLMIFGERHIRPGDIVEVGDQVGEVIAVSMRGTTVRTFDNIDMVIPNSEFITTKVVNWSLQSRQIRGQLNIGVAYGSDIELVRDLLLKVAEEHPKVLKQPEPIVWFLDFGDNALIFRLLVHFDDLSDRYSSLTEMRFTLNKLFAEHGITIPFPQRTLSLIDDKPLRVELLNGDEENDDEQDDGGDEPDDSPDRPKRKPRSKRKRRGAGAADQPGMGMVDSGGDE